MLFWLNITLCATMIFKVDHDDYIVLSKQPHGSCPWCCPLNIEKDIRFLLYTRRNREKGVIISHSNPGKDIKISTYNPQKPTIFFLHGFIEQATSLSSTAIKNAYLDTGDYNIILMDWSTLSAGPWYITAVNNSYLVGRILARFLTVLDRRKLIPLENVHVIGFSLGAEVAGFAGKAMPKNRRIPRITGLDPAFPLYFGGPQFHLSKGDADFVDVIHTDAGILGYPYPIGDVDFYPNMGIKFQPGCIIKDVVIGVLSCSHLRAWQYYAESIRNPEGFPATRCVRWRGVLPPCNFRLDNFMGIKANPRSNGRFFLETNSSPPFAKRAQAT